MDYHGIPALQFVTHHIAARLHSARLAPLRWISAYSAMEFPGIDFNVRAALLHCPLNLRVKFKLEL
jgi:hypothetical protein